MADNVHLPLPVGTTTLSDPPEAQGTTAGTTTLDPQPAGETTASVDPTGHTQVGE